MARYVYADPPYLGVCHRYGHRHDAPYGCWDDLDTWRFLVSRLTAEYDGWALSTGSKQLPAVLSVCPDDVRVAAWVKPFAAFKPGVRVPYCWEAVIFTDTRPVSDRVEPSTRDFLSEPMTMRRGFVGAKPARFAWWVRNLLGARADDEIIDLFTGSGAVSDALAHRAMF